jgi:hypothetical protein
MVTKTREKLDTSKPESFPELSIVATIDSSRFTRPAHWLGSAHLRREALLSRQGLVLSVFDPRYQHGSHDHRENLDHPKAPESCEKLFGTLGVLS